MLKKLLPIISWLPEYKSANFWADLQAGLTVGVMLIPQGMAYAMIAGLPIEFGLYASLIPQIIYTITGTSRQLSVGPVAMDSLLVAAGLSVIATIGSSSYINMAILLSLIMGCILLILGIMRAGFIVKILIKPVISGFTSAAALIISANQIANLTGIPIERDTKIQNIVSEGLNTINQFNQPTVLIGILTIIIISMISKVKSKIKLPSALIAVLLGIICVKWFRLNWEGVKIVGDIPRGLPSFGVPNFDSTIKLLPIAFTLALIAFMEAYSVSKALSEKHGYKIDPNQELRALGVANIIGSFFQSYPTTGGFSRTAVNDQAGASTPLSSLFASSLIALTLLFFTPLFYHLPLAVLAAIIISAVMSFFDPKLPIKLWKNNRIESLLLIATFCVTLFMGMVEGIVLGILLSFVHIIYKRKR